ncbi:MAG: glycosyltransferase family 2 protein [Chloroflexi bacterium]|nr:glycosyltransferase family 2 protein [Chloroflexota bacterium]
MQLTILMPCLNEAETLATCIRKAHQGAEKAGLSGDDYEVLIADNGSTDGSQAIAQAEGARLIHVPVRGYGAALIAGIEHACGEFVLMGDSDDSYDFAAIKPFVDALNEGYELVMGTRLKGEIKPGAMPFLHQYLGNPVLTFLGNVLFSTGMSDFHCGLRGFRRDAIQRLDLQTTGMEFASEMVIRSSLADLKRTEIPITLYPDGRSRPPHLRTWRDGWRHLQFMLLYSPKWVFILPGVILLLLSSMVTIVLLFGPVSIGGTVFDVHTLIVAAAVMLNSIQFILMGLLAIVFTARQHMLPPMRWTEWLVDNFSLGLGLIVSSLLIASGLAIYGVQFLRWSSVDFGPLNYQETIRPIVLGTIFFVVGIQTFFWSFMVSLLNISTRSRL